MPHSSIYSIFSSLFALAVVLGLIMLAARLLRAGGFTAKAGGRMQLQSSLMLDARRRLILVRVDQREYLILTGGANDLLIDQIGGPKP